jgi:hypothetical protein
MRTRTSIELFPGGCRLAEVVPSTRGRRAATPGDVRVTGFSTGLPGEDDPRFTESLQNLRTSRKLPKRAVVTLWGLRSTQQLLRLPPAKFADLQLLAAREARKDIAPLETDGARASVAIALGNEVQVGTHRRREVSLVAASSSEVRRRIQPIVDAGFVVDGVVTPALALADVARAHRDLPAGTTAAYVAITADATCVAIVRDGLLLFAREMPWGHRTAPDGGTVADRLASELRRSILFFKQTFRAPVEAVALCGDMRSLRLLTAPLGSALAVPVHTLDALAGLDAESVPEPADQFRGAVASLRLAIAAGASGVPANLMPAAMLETREARTHVTRLVLTTAAAIVLVIAWYSMLARTAGNQRREREAIDQQLAVLEPQAERTNQLRQAVTLAAARRNALVAFGSQGPRLGRVLEAFSRAASPDVVLSAITTQADGASWRVTVKGLAVTADAASGQAALNTFLKALADSPFVGMPIAPPSLKVISAAPAAPASRDEPRIPETMSGVEFTLQFQVAR